MNISVTARAALSRAGFVPLLLVLAGCVATPPPPVPKATVSAKLPTIVALPETKEAQEKGGVEIAIVPATYTTALKRKYSVAAKSPGFGSMLGASLATGGKSSNLIYVEESISPFLDVVAQQAAPATPAAPARLQFTVRVNNKLSRVFRGQGAVVQFNVGGKLVPFGETDYGEVINGIVPPRNENTFVIRGPRLEALPDKGTIGIFLYDVVTQTDVAGNVVEKQNYEWYFDYSTKVVESQAETSHSEVFMDPGQYQHAMLTARKRSMEDPDILEYPGSR